VEQAHVQARAHARRRLLDKAHGRAARRIFVGLGPAVGARDHLHTVWAQHVQLAQPPANADRLHVGVAGDEQEAVPALEEVRARVVGRWPRDEIEQRVLTYFLRAVVE
jgi:hypothetical protein